MHQPPRPLTTTFLNLRELSISIVQGLMITLGTLFMYQYAVEQGATEDMTRTMVFATLVIANVFLTFANRSFYASAIESFAYKNDLLLGVVALTVVLLLSLTYIPTMAGFFKLVPLTASQFGVVSLVAFVSVVWFEAFKWGKRKKFW